MDVNRQRAFLLSDVGDWGNLTGVAFDGDRQTLRLASVRPGAEWADTRDVAKAWLEIAPGSTDSFGTFARWDAATRRIMASGAFPDETPIYSADAGVAVTDVALGYDEVLYLAATDRVLMLDMRGRFNPVVLAAPDGFAAFRLAAAPGGGAYVLDRSAGRLARVSGRPLGLHGIAYDPDVFRPRPEDPDPPRLTALPAASLPDGETAVAIAASPGGRAAVLSWVDDGPARLRELDAGGRTGPRVFELAGARSPYSLTWLSDGRIAVLLPGVQEAPAYDVPLASELPSDAPAVLQLPCAGDFYPLRAIVAGAPFLHGVTLPPRYPVAGGARPLVPISWPSFAPVGSSRNARLLDAGGPRTVWHRLYLEASLPPGCGVKVHLATTNDPQPPGDDDDGSDGGGWHEHRFGVGAAAFASDPAPDVPVGAWVREPSELPFHASLLPCDPVPDRVGLFGALIQRAGLRVRSLAGRYLWVRLELFGNGRATPEVAAVRAYADRLSYADRYLPALFREQVLGVDADAAGPATPADFLGRFLALFESVLTPLEDRIKSAWLLTDPRTVPEESLEWLSAWIGFVTSDLVPPDRRRLLIAAAPELYRRRGTWKGLSLAIDLATGGAVGQRQVVVLEDYVLRRVFATILGANLDAADNPLLAGPVESGNSFVGDTLFLGEENQKEFLALFAADLTVNDDEAAAIASLFDRLAHRATVLVDRAVFEQQITLVSEIVAREAPAHVQVRIMPATQRFVIGASSLVRIDSFLEAKPAPAPAAIDTSTLGAGDRIQHLPSLDPRLGQPTQGAKP